MPPLDWRSPDRKTYRLNIPISAEVREMIRAKAEGKGVTQTEWARTIIVNAARGKE